MLHLQTRVYILLIKIIIAVIACVAVIVIFFSQVNNTYMEYQSNASNAFPIGMQTMDTAYLNSKVLELSGNDYLKILEGESQ